MRLLRLSYAEAEQMFKRMVFNVVARNCDDHTKNFAFLMDTQGKWKLAPAYDICFAYRPDSVWMSQHNLSINGKRKSFERKDLITIAEQNSIRNPEKIVDQALGLVKNWNQYAEMYQVDPVLAQQIASELINEMK